MTLPLKGDSTPAHGERIYYGPFYIGALDGRWGVWDSRLPSVHPVETALSLTAARLMAETMDENDRRRIANAAWRGEG